MKARARFRVVVLRRVKSPNHWGVQRLAGYTDGKPSYQLLRERYWSRETADATAAHLNRTEGNR